MTVLQDLFHCGGDRHAAGDKQTDAKGCDGHHDRVCQEIKEIQKLHAYDRNIGQGTIPQAGQGSQYDDLDTDQDRAYSAVPVEFIREGRHCAFRQSNGTCEC